MLPYDVGAEGQLMRRSGDTFHPFEVNVPHLTYTFLGAFVVIFGMFSLFIKERLYLGEAPIATMFGIIIGPHVLNLFNPYAWGGAHEEITDEITLEVTRVVIAIGVFAVGVELPKAYMLKHWRSLFFLLGPCMIWGWFVSALFMWALIPGITYLSALVIAAGVTPTDPILAQSVVGGKFADKHVPAHIRHLLSAESGSNDGAAFPFLFIAVYLTLDASPGHAVGEWFYYTLAYEILLGTILGALLGWVARKVMKFSERKKLIDRQSFVAQYVSLAVLAIGMTSLLGSDDLLSAFACGCAFAWDGFFNQATEDSVFSNVIDLLFNCAAFIYIGAWIPFGNFNNAELNLPVWRLVALTLCVLAARRLPVILALYKFIPDIKTFREALFTGWFGPMGVGAVFISTFARINLPLGAAEKDTEQVDRIRDVIIPVTAFLVLSSVLTHGLSIPFFSLGRRVHSITYTWSRHPSMDTRRDNEPAWTTHARRIVPGQEIIINRDDDAEEGDIGIRQNAEKLQTSDSSGSSSGVQAELNEKQSRSEERRERDEEDNAARGEHRHDVEDDVSESSRSGRRTPRREPTREGTPPLAEFREGNHLIIERKSKEGDEVEVEVIRNHFLDEKPSESSRFTHPHRLKNKEVSKLADHLPHSLAKATSQVEDHGAHAIDKAGLGLMPAPPTPSFEEPQSDASSHSSTAPSPNRRRGPGLEITRSRRMYAEEEGDGPASGSSSEDERRVQPKIKEPKKGLRQRLFGRRKSNEHPRKAEEGRSDPHLLSPPMVSSPQPIEMTERSSNLQLSRTMSIPRTTSIRFDPGVSGSSDTAPTMTNYGSSSAGFQPNPTLSLFRSASMRSQTDGPSVTFKEPEKRG